MTLTNILILVSVIIVGLCSIFMDKIKKSKFILRLIIKVFQIMSTGVCTFWIVKLIIGIIYVILLPAELFLSFWALGEAVTGQNGGAINSLENSENVFELLTKFLPISISIIVAIIMIILFIKAEKKMKQAKTDREL